MINIKVLLINSPSIKQARFGEPISVYPPLGILYVSSYLRKNLDYVSIRAFDGAKEGFNKTIKSIDKEDADIIGVSFTTWGASGAFKLINMIKENHPETFIISGGPHPSALPKESLEKSKTDIVAIGEGEKTMLEVVEQLNKSKPNFKKVKGIAFRENKKIIFTRNREYLNIDSIPFPARDILDIKSYPGLYWSKKQPETNMLTSRGCTHKCTFCSNPVWKANTPWIRLRSPQNISDEVELLQDKFGIREVSDESDCFNTNLNWAMDVCKKMKTLDVSWKVQIRANKMTNELAKSMADSGCWLARVGIESVNPEVLRGIKKDITIDQVISTCKKLKKYGIKVIGLFMIFNVWEENGILKYESEKMCENTFKFVEKMLKEKLMDSFSWAFATPFPSSELFDIAKKYDLIEKKDYEVWNQASNFVMKLPGIKDEDLRKIKIKGMMLQWKSMMRREGLNPKVFTLYAKRTFLLYKILLDQLKFSVEKILPKK